jgi:hypothetical protein
MSIKGRLRQALLAGGGDVSPGIYGRIKGLKG